MKDGYFTIIANLPYRVHSLERSNEMFKTDQKITCTLLRHAVNNKWAQNMPRTDSRIWGEIQDVLLEEPEFIELTKSQFEWLFDVINNYDFPAGLSSWRWTLVHHLEEVRSVAPKKLVAVASKILHEGESEA